MLGKVENGTFSYRNFAIFIEIVNGFEVIVGILLNIWNELVTGK